ncbi:beta strand repeat-containing protein [Fibrella aestuarina]|uniref:beta strand repeat-containing protein n=1 Tax=Fibrella aestuarina TaxID=651143 RepID=UPI0011D21301|nr:hypothetical protein [Fibrella aestuarina]
MVANYNTSNVTTYTNVTTTPTFSGSLINSGTTLNQPNSILLYRDTLYVANAGGGAAGAGFIRKYNPVTGAQYGTGNFTSGLSFPERLVIGPDGNIFVADYGSNSIKRININNGVVLNTYTLATLTGQQALGIEFVGADMYVTRGTINTPTVTTLGRIERYTFSNNYATISLPTLVASYVGGTPRGITTGPDGLIYVTIKDPTGARVERFSPGVIVVPTTFLTMDAGSNPYQGLNWSPDGFLYVADFGENEVQVYNSSGTEITTRNITGQNGPHFVQFYCPCAATTVFTPSNLTLCSGASGLVQITSTNANPQITYRYASSSPNTTITGPTTTSAASNTITISSTTTSTFSVTITDRIGCSAVAGGTLSINALPTPTLTNATICVGQTATLTATGGTSYTLVNTGTVNTTGIFSVTPSSTTTYTVTAANSNNCTATATGTVTVNQLPVVTLTSSTVCAGQIATLTATSGLASYTFSPGLTQVGGSAGNTATIVGSGTATTAYSVTAASSAGCLATATGSVTVRAVPVATAVSTTATCASPATVSGTSSLTGSSFSWTGPSAFASTAQSFTTNTPGTYTLVVTTNGCSSSAVTTTVVSNTAPPALTLSSATVCAGQTATLTATAGLSNYVFSAGLTQVGGATGNTATIVGSGSATTAYSVTATNAAGCTAVASGSVTVRPNPVATAVSTTATCATAATVSGTSSLTGSSFSWTGPSAFASTAQSFTTNTPGTYTLVVTTNGCSSSAVTTTVVQDIVAPQNVAATNTGPITCAQPTASVSASSSTGGVSYRWSGPNSFTSSAQSFVTSLAGLYSVTVTGANGCTAAATTSVISNTAPPAITLSSATVCAGQTATLTATAGLTSYVFSAGLTQIGGAAGNTATIVGSGSNTTVYSVTATNAVGCTAVASGSVTVNPNPVGAATTSGTITCATAATVSGTSSLTGSSFSWTGPSAFASTAQSFTTNTPGTYTLVVTANGCSSTAVTTTVTSNTVAPTATLSSTAICAGQTATLTAGSGTSYVLNPGNLSNTTGTFAVTPTNTTTYTVVVTGANGCTAAAQGTVTVNPLPTASVTPSATAICAGQTVTLTANGGTSYRWSTGATTASIPVTTAGTYSVTATNASGCTAVAQGTVTVNPLPTPTLSSTVICAGQTATLTATGGTSYTLSPGNLSNTTGTFTIAPAATTTYTVVVSNASGCTAATQGTITVNPVPVATAVSTTATCATAATVSGTSSLTGSSFSWTGPSAFASTAQSFTTNTPGTYTLVVTTNGCSSSAVTTTVVQDIVAPQNVAATNTGPITCAQPTASVSASSSTGGVSYRWSGPNSFTSSAQSFVTSLAGLYSVTVTGANGCTAAATTSVISNTAPPTATLTASNTVVCAGEVVTLTAGGGTSYRWSTGATTAILSVTSTGTYSVTVTNANGCTAVASLGITVNPLPQLTVNSATVCAGTSTSLTLGGCVGGTVRWSTGSASATLLVTPLATTTYSVTCTFPTSCFSTTVATVTVTGAPTYGNTPTLTQATCTGNRANNDARIDFTALQNTVRADIVLGSSYGAGPAFGAPSNKIVVGNSVSFTNLPNPTQPQDYTVRLFGSDGNCITDVVVVVAPAECPCLNKCISPIVVRIVTR